MHPTTLLTYYETPKEYKWYLTVSWCVGKTNICSKTISHHLEMEVSTVGVMLRHWP